MAKNQKDGQLEWLSRNNHMTIQLQMSSECFTCFQRAMQLSGWSKARLLYKQHYTIMAPKPQYPQNDTNWQLEWLLRNNHMTIQTERCCYCFLCFQREIQLSGWSKARLLYKHHTIITPYNTPCDQNHQKPTRWGT